MMFGMRVRGGLLAALIMVAAPMAGALVSVPAAAQTVASIAVEGNRRVEVETIRSYFKPGPGGRLGQAQIDDGLKALIETGLFQDVRINQVGGRLVVTVVENAVIGRIAFEGNKKVKDEQLSAESCSSLTFLLPSNAIRPITAFSTTVTTRRPPTWLIRTSWNRPVSILSLIHI